MRPLADAEGWLGRDPEVEKEWDEVKVEDVMTRDVVAVRPETSLKEVAGVLAMRKISGLPVVAADGEVVGVVSEADVLFKERGPSRRKGVLAWLLDPFGREGQLKLEARTAAEAMTRPAKTIAPWRPLAAAAAAMLEQRVNRLPVVDSNRRLVGIVTRADLVRAFARRDGEIEREIREDVLRRTLWLRSPEAVTVKVVGGSVRLTGLVDTRTDAELVRVLVANVTGVVDVDSSLSWHEDDRGRR
jgi:CBS-domain-containing membrane protein